MLRALRSWLRQRVVVAARAQPVDLRGRQVIVTGASPGSIGYETARTLAAWGAAVTITTRRDPQAAAAQLRAQLGADARIDADTLDLSDAASVARFAGNYRRRHGGRLDLLVNNAGIHLDLLSEWKTPQLTADGHEIHWRTNYLGTAQLTRLLLPLLLQTARDQGEARVVNVVSQLHAKGCNAGLFAALPRYNSWVAYGLSKLALMHETFELQRRHGGEGLQAFALHPGEVYTRIADKGLAGHPLLARLRRALAPVEAFFLMTPDEGAQTSLFCATQPGLAGGQYWRRCRPAPASADAADAAVAARLWQQTALWCAALPERAA